MGSTTLVPPRAYLGGRLGKRLAFCASAQGYLPAPETLRVPGTPSAVSVAELLRGWTACKRSFAYRRQISNWRS